MPEESIPITVVRYTREEPLEETGTPRAWICKRGRKFRSGPGAGLLLRRRSGTAHPHQPTLIMNHLAASSAHRQPLLPTVSVTTIVTVILRSCLNRAARQDVNSVACRIGRGPFVLGSDQGE